MEQASQPAADEKGTARQENSVRAVFPSEAGRVPFSSWFPCLIAVGLMALAIYQTHKILALKTTLRAQAANILRLQKSNGLLDLRLTPLDVRDPAYGAGRVLVAWDPYGHRGILSVQGLPAPPAGQDYELWILDPGAPAPIPGGPVGASAANVHFGTGALTTANPGFAITLEPAGGGGKLTGSILFAVAPIQ